MLRPYLTSFLGVPWEGLIFGVSKNRPVGDLPIRLNPIYT